MPDPRERARCPSTQGKCGAVLRELRHGPARAAATAPKVAFGGGLKVTTTIDLGLQKIAREAIAKVLPQIGTNPAVALVAIDAQHRARCVAMVGGANYHKSQFNLATQGERQPGSSFKPFVLATALKEGIAPSTILTSSKPVTIDTGGRLWQVNNYEGEDLGPIDLSQAIAYSDNSVFSQLTAIVGPGNVAATAHQLGITTPLNGYFAIGLGAEPATPLEMARAYAIVRRRRLPHRRLDLRQRAARDRARSTSATSGTSNEPVAHDVLELRPGGDDQPAAAGRRAVRHRHARRRSRAGRSPARPGRPRTTATRGSSATRRSSSPPSGSATPTSWCR